MSIAPRSETSSAVPVEWEPPAWLAGPAYSRRELMWLAERLDASNRELRIVNRRLAAQLKQQHHQEEEPMSTTRSDGEPTTY